MYKKMMPADVVAREAHLQPVGYRANASSAAQSLPFFGNRDKQLEKELTEWKERCLRLAADFRDFKKRTLRESERRATELRSAFIRDLLPIVDTLERTLTNDPAHSTERLDEGVQSTLRQLMQVVHQHGFIGGGTIPVAHSIHNLMRRFAFAPNPCKPTKPSLKCGSPAGFKEQHYLARPWVS